MAGPNIFVVYDNDERSILHVRPTFLEADALARTGQTAHRTGLNEAQDADGATVDAGITVDENSGWFFYDAAPHLRQSPPDPYPLRALYRAYHTRLQYLYAITQSQDVAANHDPEHIRFAQRVIFGMHEGCWSIHHRDDLNAADEVNWHRLQAMGPADGPLASASIVSPASDTAILKITMPGALAFGSDGNAWEVTVQRGGADSYIIDRDDQSIDLTLTGTKTLINVAELLRADALFDTENVTVAGNQNAVFPIPASQSEVGAYPLSGGSFLYSGADPRTFADVVSELTAEQFRDARFRSFSFVTVDFTGGAIGSRPMARRTLAQAVDDDADVAGRRGTVRKYFPTVYDLRYGDWIEGIMA